MRIHHHDRLFDSYTATTTISGEGYETKVWAVTTAGFSADAQPIGNKFTPEAYGIDGVSQGAKKLFADSDLALTVGMAIKDKTTLAKYLVKGLREWYSHKEYIIEPYEATLP